MKNQSEFPLVIVPRRTLRQANSMMSSTGWHLPKEAFGDMGPINVNDMIDFEMKDYVYFLDHVATRADLIAGLALLSPFADDALSRAEVMSDDEFVEFKKLLPAERQSSLSDGANILPERYLVLVLPERFLAALMLNERAGCSLGMTMLRIMEYEQDNPD